MLAGKVNQDVRHVFFGANLLALKKSDGGLRPIAIGSTLRRLVAKVGCRSVASHVQAYLAPKQLGFGTKLGAEAAIHCARSFLRTITMDQVMVKLDFQNAFNSIRRDKVLEACLMHIPELYPLVYCCYSSHSHLFYEEAVIMSQEGVQQGDPLGPLLFCLAIQPLVKKLQSELTLFYLDDGLIGGAAQVVLNDISLIQKEAIELGLQLNINKSELIATNVNDSLVLEEFPDFVPVHTNDATFLGAPIGSLQSIDLALLKKCDDLRIMADRLSHFTRHDSLVLLRHAFAIPKVLYLLRTSPCFQSALLVDFDSLLRSTTSTILNINLSNEEVWMQASLPVSSGGLGIRSAYHLAPSAFLASVSGSQRLSQAILPLRLHNDPLACGGEALAMWRSFSPASSPPSGPVASLQRAWDRPLVTSRLEALVEKAPDSLSKARLLGAATKESGAWLNAPPVTSLGLRMDDDTITISASIRLGLAFCRPHHCTLCGAFVDELALHGLSCHKSPGRHSRHNAINDIIHRTLTAAGVPCQLEPHGLNRDDGKRPDGVTLLPWKDGRPLIWDATCSDTFATSYTRTASSRAGAVAEQAEARKSGQYRHLTSKYHFAPVSCETSGTLGPETIHFLRGISRRLQLRTGEPLSYQFLIQRLSVAIQRGNAMSILGTLNQSDLAYDVD